MSAELLRLRTKRDRLKADQAKALRQMVLEFPGLSERAAGELVAAIDRQTASENGWTFVMLSPEDNAKVVSWLLENSQRPMIAVHLWSKLFLHLRWDTNEITQTREELAESLGIDPKHISEIMGELETFGAISRRRIKVPGMRGPGVVHYFMSPRIGTHLPPTARAIAQSKAPQLRVVDPSPD